MRLLLLRWLGSPYLIDGDYYDVTQPAIKTNKTMTAKVVFSKTIKHAFLRVYYAPSDENDVQIPDEENYVTWSYDTDNAIINFLQNATVDLYFTSLNGAGTIKLTIDDIIDKEPQHLPWKKTDNATDTTALLYSKTQ